MGVVWAKETICNVVCTSCHLSLRALSIECTMVVRSTLSAGNKRFWLNRKTMYPIHWCDMWWRRRVWFGWLCVFCASSSPQGYESVARKFVLKFANLIDQRNGFSYKDAAKRFNEYVSLYLNIYKWELFQTSREKCSKDFKDFEVKKSALHELLFQFICSLIDPHHNASHKRLIIEVKRLFIPIGWISVQ